MLWLNTQGEPQTWAPHPFLACQYKHEHYHLFIAFNTGNETLSIKLPAVDQKFHSYEVIIDSALGFLQQPRTTSYTLHPHTILVAKSHKQRELFTHK